MWGVKKFYDNVSQHIIGKPFSMKDFFLGFLFSIKF